MTTSVLFICMGNICRSPLADGVFRTLVEQRGVADQFEIDSAGTTSYHSGEPADPRMREVAQQEGLVLTSRARQVKRDDFTRFDHLICMDEDNREHILHMGAPEDRVRLLLEIDPNSDIDEVPDPYYGGADGFQIVYRLVRSACEALLDDLLTQRPARQS